MTSSYLTMQNNQSNRELNFEDNEKAAQLYGDLNKNIQVLENGANVKVFVRGSDIKITGAEYDVKIAANLLSQLYDLIGTGYPVYSSDFAFGLKILQSTPGARLDKIFLDKVYVTTRNRVISPKTPNQKRYIRWRSGTMTLSLVSALPEPEKHTSP